MRLFRQGFAEIAVAAVIAFCGLTAMSSSASGQDKYRGKADRSAAAAAMLEKAIAGPDAAALKELIGRAKAVAVFPVMREQTAFFLETSTGDGVVSVRTENGWTKPALFALGTVRYRGIFVKGRKFGAIVLFMKDDALPVCGKENITFEAKKNVLSGPVGTLSDDRRAGLKDALMVAYVYLNGKLMPTAPDRRDWDGFTLNDQDKLNKRVYGIRTCDVLGGKTPLKSPVGITAYRDLLQRTFGK